MIQNAWWFVHHFFNNPNTQALIPTVFILGVTLSLFGSTLGILETKKPDNSKFIRVFVLGVFMFFMMLDTSGQITLNDDVTGNSDIIPNLPNGIVMVAGIVNTLTVGIEQEIITASAPPVAPATVGYSTGMKMIREGHEGFMKTALATQIPSAIYQTIDSYCQDCLSVEVAGNAIFAEALANTNDFSVGFGAGATPALYVDVNIDSSGTPISTLENVTCAEAYIRLDNFFNSADWNGVVDSFCSLMNFDIDNNTSKIACKQIFDNSLHQWVGAGMTSTNFAKQTLLGYRWKLYLSSLLPHQSAQASAHLQAASKMTASGFTSQEWLPVLRNVILMTIILSSVIVLLLTVTGIGLEAFKYLFGIFIFWSVWCIIDTNQMIHWIAETDRLFKTLKTHSQVGTEGLTQLWPLASKSLSLMANMREKGILLASSLVFALFKFGGSSFARYAGGLVDKGSASTNEAAEHLEPTGKGASKTIQEGGQLATSYALASMPISQRGEQTLSVGRANTSETMARSGVDNFYGGSLTTAIKDQAKISEIKTAKNSGSAAGTGDSTRAFKSAAGSSALETTSGNYKYNLKQSELNKIAHGGVEKTLATGGSALAMAKGLGRKGHESQAYQDNLRQAAGAFAYATHQGIISSGSISGNNYKQLREHRENLTKMPGGESALLQADSSFSTPLTEEMIPGMKNAGKLPSTAESGVGMTVSGLSVSEDGKIDYSQASVSTNSQVTGKTGKHETGDTGWFNFSKTRSKINGPGTETDNYRIKGVGNYNNGNVDYTGRLEKQIDGKWQSVDSQSRVTGRIDSSYADLQGMSPEELYQNNRGIKNLDNEIIAPLLGTAISSEMGSESISGGKNITGSQTATTGLLRAHSLYGSASGNKDSNSYRKATAVADQYLTNNPVAAADGIVNDFGRSVSRSYGISDGSSNALGGKITVGMKNGGLIGNLAQFVSGFSANAQASLSKNLEKAAKEGSQVDLFKMAARVAATQTGDGTQSESEVLENRVNDLMHVYNEMNKVASSMSNDGQTTIPTMKKAMDSAPDVIQKGINTTKNIWNGYRDLSIDAVEGVGIGAGMVHLGAEKVIGKGIEVGGEVIKDLIEVPNKFSENLDKLNSDEILKKGSQAIDNVTSGVTESMGKVYTGLKEVPNNILQNYYGTDNSNKK
jgi:hypothetical protein